MKDHKTRWVECLLTEHEFRHEDILFPTNTYATVNYRMICQHCGCYAIHAVDAWDDDAGPYIHVPLHRGPEGRMHQLWINRPEL